MSQPVEVASEEQRQRFCALAPAPLDPATVSRQRPDAMLLLDDAARCSLWWRRTPPYESHRLGYVGHYAVGDARAAPELLGAACDRLAAEGCTLAVGPVDGSTWQRYRFITERGSEPPFFLEPDNPDDYPGQWTGFGFRPLAEYTSAVNTNLSAQDPRLTLIAQRLHDLGIVVHALDPERFDEDLRRVHALSLASFRDNFLYVPLSEADFLAQYAPLRPHLRPDLVLLAERRGELVGYLLAVPDLLQPRRGEPMTTVIVKTMAVRPDHGGLGLGGLLMGRIHEAARKAGFTRALHALMHEANRSGRISGHTARVFRHYTLFARALKEQG